MNNDSTKKNKYLLNGSGKSIISSWNQLKVPLAFFCAFVLLHNWLEIVLTSIIVEPVLSKIKSDNSLVLIVTILILSLISLRANRSVNRDYHFSLNWMCWCLMILTLYAYYRFWNKVWIFTPISLSSAGALKISDFPIAILLLVYIANIFKWVSHNRPPIQSELNGFITDDISLLNANNDDGNRFPLIQHLVDRILSTKNEKSSFAIAIIGKWGIGKTSFMKSMERLLKDNKNVHQFTFNPWLVEEVGNITKAFFFELSSELSMYHTSLKDDLTDYTNLLFDNNKDNFFYMLTRHLATIFGWESPSLQEKRKKVNEVLNKLNKKIIIYIDDLDRLDGKETTEVLRIIRNSADFGNIIFVVALDKAHVDSVVRGIFGTGDGNRFLEKIFQLEFYIPPVKSDELLSNLIRYLDPYLSAQDKGALKNMFDASSSYRSYQGLQKTLKHYRDIKRYVNLFLLQYNFLKGNVYFPDLVTITFIRLKYPEVYYFFHTNREVLLDAGSDLQSEHSGYYLFKVEGGDGKTILNTVLENRKTELNIHQTEIPEILNLFELAFGLIAKDDDKMDYYNAHLQIRYPKYFERYFDLNLYGRLSQLDFDEAFINGDNTLFDLIKKHKEDNSIIIEIINAIDRFPYTTDLASFKRTISALIYISELDSPNALRDELRKVLDEKMLINKINKQAMVLTVNSNGPQNSKLVHSLFGDKQTYKAYVYDLFKSHAKLNTLMLSILEGALNEKNLSFPLSSLEILGIISEVFDKVMDSEKSVSTSLFHLYSDLLNNVKDDKIKNNLTEKLRNFILTQDIDGFIVYIIQPNHMRKSGRMIAEWPKEIFGSLDEFIYAIQPPLNSKYRAEFIEFVTAYKGGGTFDFKEIPVKSNNFSIILDSSKE